MCVYISCVVIAVHGCNINDNEFYPSILIFICLMAILLALLVNSKDKCTFCQRPTQ